MKVWKCEEWCGGSGYWYCNDTSDLAGVAGKWWIPARILELSPVDYVKWLIENHSPDYIDWNGETLVFAWKSQAKMRKYKNQMNKLSRDKKFMV